MQLFYGKLMEFAIYAENQYNLYIIWIIVRKQIITIKLQMLSLEKIIEIFINFRTGIIIY